MQIDAYITAKALFEADYDHQLLKSQFKNAYIDSLIHVAEVVEFPDKNKLQDINLSWSNFCSYNSILELISQEREEEIKGILNNLINSSSNCYFIRDFDDLDILEQSTVKNWLGKEKNFNEYLTGLKSSNIAFNETYQLLSAIKLISTHFPNHWLETCNLTDEIVLLHNSGKIKIHSASNFYTFGLILINILPNNSLLHYIEHLVHEISHLFLYIISTKDSLVKNRDEEIFVAPFRKDKRPMTGIFHAFFVLARIIYVFNKLQSSIHELPSSSLEELRKRNKILRIKFDESVQIMKQSAKFTNLGSEIFNILQRAVYSMTS